MRFGTTLGVIGVAAMVFVSGCAGQKAASSDVAKAPAYEIPASAQPAKELLPLSFMVGRWVCINANKTVNDEHWMTPRGNHMTALFKQARRDGKPALIEVSLVTVEPDGSVKLALRHLHAALDDPKGKMEMSYFTLKSAGDNRAEFAGTDRASNMLVVYRLDGPDKMMVDVTFPPDSKEKSYSMTYFRER